MRVVVVGGGVAGLHVSLSLAERGMKVCLMETRPALGGRVRTAFEDVDGGGARVVSYEAGAWRVDEAHGRVRALFRRFDVNLVPAPAATAAAPVEAGGGTSAAAGVPGVGLTTWGRDALTGGVEEADRRDARSGYAGANDSAHGSAPYYADGPFLVAPDGFSTLVDRLHTAVVAAGVDVRTNTRVVDVATATGGYRVRARVRVGRRFRDDAVDAEWVVLCLPPHAWGEWPLLREHARSLRSAVEAEVLQHVYVRGGGEAAVSRVVPDVGHVVAAQYAQSDWWQVSYSSGRVATMWRDYAMQDERGFLERVRSLAEKLVGGGSPVSEVRRHLWPFAFHKWRAVPNFDLARAVATGVRVNPVRLPRVLCAGEAFSSHQGWMEGALETAELAVAAVTARDGVTPRPDVVPDRTFAPREWTVYVEGLRLDVRAFADVHPGGIAALREHVGEHLDDYMLQFDHSPHAWAVVHSLKPWCYAADAAACEGPR